MLHVPSPLSHEQFQVVSIPSRSPRLIIAVDPSTRTLVLGGSFIVLNFNFSSKAPMGDETKRTKAMSPILTFLETAITQQLHKFRVLPPYTDAAATSVLREASRTWR